MKAITRYKAADGQEFDTAEACKAYEVESAENLVAGVTVEQVQAATAGRNVALRDAFETIGNRCAAARLQAGQFRRPKKTADAKPAEAVKGRKTKAVVA